MADNTSNVSVNDVSDISIVNPQTSDASLIKLPIRGEKRFIPEDPLSLIGQAFNTALMFGQTTTSGAPSSDFFVTAALAEFTDYVMVQNPPSGSGKPQPRSAISNSDITLMRVIRLDWNSRASGAMACWSTPSMRYFTTTELSRLSM